MTDATRVVCPGPSHSAPVIEHLSALARVPFESTPRILQRCVYGVPYVQLDDATGGRLWVTEHGWRHLENLDPSRWYLHQQYAHRGQRLSGGTGAVYRVSSIAPSGNPWLELVVKFSRMAQDLPVHVSSQFPGGVSQYAADSCVFNDPFQEFELLEGLRNSRLGPPELRIRTKRPLAVYSPGKTFPRWQLGRTEDQFMRHVGLLERDQQTLPVDMQPVTMQITRQYLYLFHWVRGHDAQHLVQQGELSSSEAAELVLQVLDDLAAKGFRVLDTKPGHIILRRRRAGGLLKRRGKFVYALVDFELLQRSGKDQV